ncbi:MAG: quinolinate synthase NadA [Actinomycetes bacterium]
MLRISTAMSSDFLDATPDQLDERIATAKAALGDRLLILGHHYQMDEVMKFADVRGDSFGLSRIAADRGDADLIVFCGVHFMAESADILTGPHQQVVLPDLSAGCSMADMADIDQVEAAWSDLERVTDTSRIMPITYMNSTAAIKAFVGRHGGAVCTSSNAKAVLAWALMPDEHGVARADKVLFFPDQHLGRNTAYELGFDLASMEVWDPSRVAGGLAAEQIDAATFLLWQGHCSVHQRFTTDQIERFRIENPSGVVVVHPECSHEVVQAADAAGSTDFIIRFVEATEPGTAIGIGTEVHLVKRLADEYPDRTITCLDDEVCPCITMSRIDAPHLAWVLEEAVAGRIRNQITVPTETATWARVALERMLAII